MEHHFKSIGLSFKNTSLEVREALSMDEQSSKRLMGFMKDFDCEELMILSTCNRTELYFTGDDNAEHALINGLALIKGIEKDKFQKHLITKSGRDAVEHLFRVSVGLEAQVVGDLQIINQVKSAYQWAADEDMAGPFLHRLMHTIFFTNKRIVQETRFRDGAASVSYAAKELVEELSKQLHDAKVLLLGLGEIGEDVARNLFDSGLDISIANRTKAKAEVIGLEGNLKVVDWTDINKAVAKADIVVSSIRPEEPIINLKTLNGIEILAHKFFIDLSVPRSIAKEVESFHGAILYNIDDIQNKTSETLQKRLDAIPEVEAIVTASLDEFFTWSKEMEVSPTIKKMKQALESIRQEELARYLKNASKEEAKILEKLSKSMMQKIMKLPVMQLKAACKRGDAEQLVDVLHELFDLESQVTKK